MRFSVKPTLSRLVALTCQHIPLSGFAQIPADAPFTLETVQMAAPGYDTVEAHQESASDKTIVSREQGRLRGVRSVLPDIEGLL